MWRKTGSLGMVGFDQQHRKVAIFTKVAILTDVGSGILEFAQIQRFSVCSFL